MITSFFGGIIAASSALVLEIFFSMLFGEEFVFKTAALEISRFLIISVLIEEIFKFLAVFKTISKKDSKWSIFLKSFLVGLGFSLLEIFLNFLKFGFDFKDKQFLVSLSGILIIHALTSGYMGYFVAALKKHPGPISSIIIIFTSFIHLLYNVVIIQNVPVFFIYSFFLALAVILFFRYLRIKSVEAC